ncbi:single-stranded-DNA-specific exonuclease RecJ [Candidatus Poribacteria bacterium]|nr:single-stranded-DNA-specific exonuclease RecJ [Candidatus Poribacteria bacterium]
MRKIWQSKKPDEELSKKLASELNIPYLIAQLMVNRGIKDSDEGRRFLYPKLSYLHPPSMMNGISDAVDRIKRAIDKGEKIWLYGDYDVDGTTSVSLLLTCLRHLGANVDYYIPHRLDEGYGLSSEGIKDLSSKGCNLLITVDCGISAIDEVRIANEAGIDLIITDHHEPGEEIPPALVVINPKLQSCHYPFCELAGVGVAFKLVQGLLGDNTGDNQDFLKKQFDLVALGTIADVVPLIGENRIIAKYGLDILNKMERTGIRALCEVAGVNEGSVNSWTVGFRLGPRINAAGRIDTAHCAVKLLTTDSYEEALDIAKKLDEANKERQNIERNILNAAIDQLKKYDLSREKGIILADDGWHPGVVGIVASRLQERYYRPAIVISLEGDEGRGSARSIPEFDIFHALQRCSHLLETFGGHKAAAGLSIAKHNIGKFRQEFSNVMDEVLTPEDLSPKVIIDMETSLDQLSEAAVENLNLLEPYGLGNPSPQVSIHGLSLQGYPRTVGNNDAHLQLTLSDGKFAFRSIAFRKGELEKELYDSSVTIDVACRPNINEWNGNRFVQLVINEIIINNIEDEYKLMAASAEIMDLSQLKIADRRNIPDKEKHIKKLLSMDEKILMYVRDDAAVDQLGKIIAKYSAKTKLVSCYNITPEEEKFNIKRDFSQGEIDVIASSVPFEETLPELKHLVFCHPVPTRELFIKFCVPAIETDEPIYVHLIFNNKDIDYLTMLLNQEYPDRKILANVYRKAKELAESRNSNKIYIEDIAMNINLEGAKDLIVSKSISVFEEIELVKRHQENGKTAVSLLDTGDQKRDLSQSQIYLTGDKLKREWEKFSHFISRKTADDIRKILLEVIT